MAAQLSRPCPRVVPVSLYRIPGPLHQVLRRYKDGVTAAARRHDALVVAALLARFLAGHGHCLASGTKGHGSSPGPGRPPGRPWDLVTIVPSSMGRPGIHPLELALTSVPWLAAQHRTVLVPAGASPLGHNRASDDAFSVCQPVAGARVVILDDTFTTGARAQSAASALALAGADVVAIVPVGRVIDPGWGPHVATWWAQREALPYDFERCCLEAGGGTTRRRSRRP